MSIFQRARSVLLVSLFLSVPLFAHPGSGIVVDRQGQVYFMDTGSGVWKIDSQGHLSKVDESRFHWMTIDLDGRFTRGRMPTSSVGDFSRARANPRLMLSSDFPVAMGHDGAFYYPDRGRSDGRLQLLRWTAAGARSVLATLPASTESGPLQWINGLAAGPDGSIYYTENTAVRRVDARGEISTVAAQIDERSKVANCIAVPGNEPDVGIFLRGLDVGADGIVYVAASGCGAVLRIGPHGDVAAVLRTTTPWSPTAVAIGGSDVYVLEYFHTATENRQEWIPRVRRLRANGTIELLATVDRK